MKAKIVIFNGFDEMDALAPFEVLQRAGKLTGNLDVQLVTIEPVNEIITAHSANIRPHGVLSQEEKPDILIIPGGGWNSRNATCSTRAEFNKGAIPKAITQMHSSGVLIAGVCTGAMLIAKDGNLQGRNAITHKGAIKDLQNLGANIIDARVVDDGDIITSGGVTSGLDLALRLVQRLYDSKIAHKIETQMEYERRGTVWRRGK